MLSRWLLSVLYILIGGANLIRGVTGWAVSSSLVTRPLSLPVVSTLYLAFGTAFLAVGVVAIRESRPRRCRTAVGLAVFYQLALWAIRVVGIQSSHARNLWSRDLLFSSVFLLVVMILACGHLGWTTKARRGQFTAPDGRDSNEQ